MVKYKYFLLVTFGLLIIGSLDTKGQDGAFSQYYTSPLFLNPAFVGSAEGFRATLNHRTQWPYVPGKFTTSGFAAGYQPNKLIDGLGVVVKKEVEGEGALSTTSASGIFARRWVIPRTMDIQAAMQVGFFNKQVKWDRLVFSDELDPIRGDIYPSAAQKPVSASTAGLDISAGVVSKFDLNIGGKKIINQAGAAFYHINQPNESLTGGESSLPVRWTIHYGMLIPSNSLLSNKTLTFYPNFRFEKQNDFTQFDLSVLAFEPPFFLGGNLRNSKEYFNYENTSQFIATAGFKGNNKILGNYMIGYSYDVSLSGLSGSNRGTHEIALMIFLEKKNTNKSSRNPEFGCEDFYDKSLIPMF